ncbi:unnamed protein product [Paramecium primaurelia]|uniref:dAMP1 SANT/Myb-like domain-containing protein n=1 Tax=Paramecium primaurelia TaxID=5886 RepID=A0A8S1QXW2_PARPR|nr:unnamed protein product [Paramecium primaurelia]
MTITLKMHPNGEKFQNTIGSAFQAFQNQNTHKRSGFKLLIQQKNYENLIHMWSFIHLLFSYKQNHQIIRNGFEEIMVTNQNIEKVNVQVPEQKKGLMFRGEKFNYDSEYFEFKEEEISIDNDWSFEETEYLFNQLNKYSYNFIVLSYRQSYQNKNRDIYELKDRYYSVVNEVLQKRNEKLHFLYNFVLMKNMINLEI